MRSSGLFTSERIHSKIRVIKENLPKELGYGFCKKPLISKKKHNAEGVALAFL